MALSPNLALSSTSRNGNRKTNGTGRPSARFPAPTPRPIARGCGKLNMISTFDDILTYNRRAWDRQVERSNPWTIPVTSEEIARARIGDWRIVLTPTKPVPAGWFPPLVGLDVLCLASGGGQQGPILAAAGANVAVLDNSPAQLAQDRLVAEREGLKVKTVPGDMAKLSAFTDAQFDLIIHPVSNVFVPDVKPVWREAFRVLKPGGTLLSGFMNPVHYLFDFFSLEAGELRVAHRIPYSDVESLSDRERAKLAEQDAPLEFGHTLDDQLGGQLAAGFVLTGFYEDIDGDTILGKHIPSFIATRALRNGTEITSRLLVVSGVADGRILEKKPGSYFRPVPKATILTSKSSRV
jgi:SAM-dependent methyltransferase